VSPAPRIVEYHQFVLRGVRSPGLSRLETPDKLLFAGEGGAVFLSGGTDHIASVKVEVWSGKPDADSGGSWEMNEAGEFKVDVATISSWPRTTRHIRFQDCQLGRAFPEVWRAAIRSRDSFQTPSTSTQPSQVPRSTVARTTPRLEGWSPSCAPR
jgi:hypothetical protein